MIFFGWHGGQWSMLENIRLKPRTKWESFFINCLRATPSSYCSFTDVAWSSKTLAGVIGFFISNFNFQIILAGCCKVLVLSSLEAELEALERSL